MQTIRASFPRGAELFIALAILAAHHAAAQTPTYSILYSFTGGSDGAQPYGGVIRGKNGALYGTTVGGGTGGQGTVFMLAPSPGPSWTESVLVNFNGANGSYPGAGLVFASNGALYGTTEIGGSGNNGTVFKVMPPATAGGAWTQTVLYSFPSGTTGQYTPIAPLLIGSRGTLFGTTFDTLFGGGGCSP